MFRRRVLVACSEPHLVGILQRYLERLGQRPVPAQNGMEAVEAIEAERPDLIVLDETFSHREWLTGILAADTELAEIPQLVLPEAAHFPPPGERGDGGHLLPETDGPPLAASLPDQVSWLLRRAERFHQQEIRTQLEWLSRGLQHPTGPLNPWNPKAAAARREFASFMLRLMEQLVRMGTRADRKRRKEEGDAGVSGKDH
jgi:hypothetical protein